MPEINLQLVDDDQYLEEVKEVDIFRRRLFQLSDMTG
jgi:hypothetical protein